MDQLRKNLYGEGVFSGAGMAVPGAVFSVIISIFASIGCVPADNHQPLPEAPPASTSGAPQTAGGDGKTVHAMPFSEVSQILQARCVRCHNSGANDWSKEENIRRVIGTGTFQQRLTSGLMPQSGSKEAGEFKPEEKDKLLAYAASVIAAQKAATQSGGTANNGGGQTTPGTGGAGQGGGSGGGGASAAASLTPFERNMAIFAKCVSCHGTDGVGVGVDTPNLASHDRKYIVGRLTGFAAPGAKGTMPGVLSGIMADFKLALKLDSDGALDPSTELSEVVSFLAQTYSNQYVNPPSDEFSSLVKKLSESEKKQYEKGKEIVGGQCNACHLQEDFRPAEGIPMIYGQKANYLNARMTEFLSGKGSETMQGVAEANFKEEEDKKAIILYLSLTHPTQGR